MTFFFHDSLLEDYYLILNDADDYDVIIKIGENSNMKEFHAHSVILRARSTYFKSALSDDWITKKNDIITFSKPNITPTVFDIILKYIYTGELDMAEQSCEDVFRLLITSDELLIEEIIPQIQDYLIEEQTSWVQNNFIQIFNTVVKLVSCKTLQIYCFEHICGNMQQFTNPKTFLSLDKDVLFELLKRDDLKIQEVAAWDYLIRWGTDQIESRNNDRKQLNGQNYNEALKKALSQFIHLIRFVKFSHADFFDKVRPYKAIFPIDYFEELEEFFYKGILPPRISKIESNVIKPKFLNKIVNWIDNDKDFRANLNYKFNLIYRGSRDGINSNSFKNKCNGRVASLVLTKVQKLNKIFGGYSSIGLNSIGDNNNNNNNNNKGTNGSLDDFTFSFENDDDTNEDSQGMELNRLKSVPDCGNNNDIGFCFGRSLMSMRNEKLYVHGERHTIEEIETFVVSKK